MRKLITIFMDNVVSYYFQCTPKKLPVLHYDITERCNARCRICNLWQKNAALKEKELTINEIREVVEDFRKLGGMIVSIGGGEPLIREDIFDIIAMINSCGLSAHMDTNALLLNKSRVHNLKKAGLKALSVSLDSHDPKVHNEIRGLNGFNSVINGITLIKEIAPEIKIIINCVLNKKNINNLIEMYDLSLRLKVSGLKFPPIHRMAKQNDLNLEEIKDLFFDDKDIDTIKMRMDEIIDYDRKYKILLNSSPYLRGVHYLYSKKAIIQNCFAGITTCLMMPYGEITPCYNFYNVGVVIGNIRDKRFLELWDSLIFKKARKKSRKCSQFCWDLCTKEPSLRFNFGFLLKNLSFALKEVNLFS